MTPTSSQQTYTDLLIQYQPKPIKTQQEYKRALYGANFFSRGF